MTRTRGNINDDEARCIRKYTSANLEDPYGYLYLLYKVHKAQSSGKPVPNRPVCLDCVSIPNPNGKWVDIKLQSTAKKMQTYLKYYFEFKKMIDNLEKLDPRARLFTYNTKSMYTNTSTEYALEGISKYLRDNQFITMITI